MATGDGSTESVTAALAALLEEPERIADLSPEAVPGLLVTISAVQNQLAALLARPKDDDGRTPDHDHLLSVEEVAKCLGVSKGRVYDLVRTGELPSVPIGKYVKVRRSTLQQWIEDREHGA